MACAELGCRDFEDSDDEENKMKSLGSTWFGVILAPCPELEPEGGLKSTQSDPYFGRPHFDMFDLSFTLKISGSCEV